MQTMKTLWSRTFPVIAALAMAFAFNATAAVPVLSIVRSGPQNIYKGSCSYSTTTFTITASFAVATNYDMYLYIGGDGNPFLPPTNACDAFRGWDFTASGTDLSIGAYGTVANLYEMGMQAGHTSAVVTITTLNKPTTNDCDYETLIFDIPAGSDYTEGSYTVNPNAGTATCNIYPSDPGEPYVGVSTSSSSISKSYPYPMTLTLTASFPFPGQEYVTFLVGGDGTTFNNDPSDCLAYYPTDFTITGANKAPFPNGFYVIFNEGDTQKQVTITPAGSGCNCDNGYQNLIITVPTPPSCSGYQPGYPSQITDYIYP